MRTTQTDDPAFDGLFLSARNVTYGRKNTTSLVVDPRSRFKDVAKHSYYCHEGNLRLSSEWRSSKAVGVRKDVGVMAIDDIYDRAKHRLEPYSHEVDGAKQDGIFVGTQGQTTWGFSWIRPEKCGELDYFEAKLQGLPMDRGTEATAQRQPRFYGFIKVTPDVTSLVVWAVVFLDLVGRKLARNLQDLQVGSSWRRCGNLYLVETFCKAMP
jgi:hypothetical protein